MKKSIQELKDEIAKRSKKGKIFTLKVDINQTKYQIKQIKQVRDHNMSELDFIEGLSLMVHFNDQDIPVTKKNIAYFNMDQEIVECRIIELERELRNYQEELKELTNDVANPANTAIPLGDLDND